MTTITTGIGANAAITYKSMTNNGVYTRDKNAVYPFIDLQGSMYVVSRVDANNGIGGTVSTGYAYAGAKVDVSGRGFLGFREMTVKDLQTNILQTTSFHQSFPFVGLVESASKKLGALTLNQTTHTYEFLNASGGITVSPTSAPYRVLLTKNVANSADLDGTPLPGVTSTYKYDSYLNPTEIVVSFSDGFSKTTTNTYTNDTGRWVLGRLTRASVKSTAP